ncbi:MAG: LysE family transporter [Candidatus Nitrosotenuis sp.]
MQDFIGFFVAVVVISASGVMAPGPLFVTTVSSAIRDGRLAGLKISIGHTVVEFPLVVAIGLGVLSLESMAEFRITASILGALSVFAFAGFQIRSILRPTTVISESKYGSFAAGVFLTGLNPFFLAWWFTIGIKLISDALSLWSYVGILVMFGLHIWMDYAWLFFVSTISAKGTRFLSDKKYKICMLALNAALVYFGISFILGVV